MSRRNPVTIDVQRNALAKSRIIELLNSKQLIDDVNADANNMASYGKWTVDVLELLLRLELERQTR
jgi:hypothetical protein